MSIEVSMAGVAFLLDLLALDFGIDGNSICTPVRLALLYYIMKPGGRSGTQAGGSSTSWSPERRGALRR
jgi:hypothetical protein